MRTKLSMAKQMLEELLAERDEMDRVHGEEMQQLEDSLQAVTTPSHTLEPVPRLLASLSRGGVCGLHSYPSTLKDPERPKLRRFHRERMAQSSVILADVSIVTHLTLLSHCSHAALCTGGRREGALEGRDLELQGSAASTRQRSRSR